MPDRLASSTNSFATLTSCIRALVAHPKQMRKSLGAVACLLLLLSSIASPVPRQCGVAAAFTIRPRQGTCLIDARIFRPNRHPIFPKSPRSHPKDVGELAGDRFEAQDLQRQLQIFMGHLQDSLRGDEETPKQQVSAAPSFVSFTLRGLSKKNSKEIKENQNEDLRGAIRMVTGRLVRTSAKKARSTSSDWGDEDLLQVQVTWKYHGATDIVKNWRLNDVSCNLAVMLGVERWNDADSAQGFEIDRFQDRQQSLWQDVSSEWGSDNLRETMVPGTRRGIQSLLLETVTHKYRIDTPAEAKRKPRLIVSRISPDATPGPLGHETGLRGLERFNHDQQKNVPVPATEPFFQALGLTDIAGKPRKGNQSAAAKLRQCQKFVEIVGNLISKVMPATKESDVRGDVPRSISVVDVGCGRGYLTFALHSYLVNQYASGLPDQRTQIQSYGVDVRPKLVDEINQIARALEGFEGLRFVSGDISNFIGDGVQSLPTKDDNVAVDVLIALHACDTATDDAIWSGIERKANVIVVAPCCHKQLRPQLDAHVAKTGPSHAMADVLRHNIYRERGAETVTDAIRAILLEMAGYTVQVFEFVGGEHTAKNVMITAIRTLENLPSQNTDELRQRLQNLSSFYGITDCKLATWMEECLNPSTNMPSRLIGKPQRYQRAFPTHGMPPLV
jgi:SAM-dependent methyltransferase